MATTTFVKTNRRFARFAATLVLILVLVLITRRAQAQEPGSDGLGDRLYPQLGNGGYDVGHYAIDLRFAPAENHITAETTISAIATQDLSSFNLDFYGLTVQSVDVNDHARRIRSAWAASLSSRHPFHFCVTANSP